MHGKIEIFQGAVLLIALVASFTDILWGRIFNWLTVPAALSGVLFSIYWGGLQGAFQATLGVIAGLLLYGTLFGFKVIGGGDVKLLMALGAWGGLIYSVQVAVAGVLLGGLIAFTLIVLTGRAKSFFLRLYFSVLSAFVKELEFSSPKFDKKYKMPFGIPISIAAIAIAFYGDSVFKYFWSFHSNVLGEVWGRAWWQ